MENFYDKNYILNYYTDVFKHNKGQAKFWDNIEPEMIPYVFASNTSETKIQIRKQLEFNSTLFEGIVQKPNYNNYSNYNSNSNQYQTQNKQQYNKRFDNNQVAHQNQSHALNQNENTSNDKFFRSKNTNQKSMGVDNSHYIEDNTYNQIKKFEKLIICTNNVNSLLKDTCFTIKGVTTKPIIVKKEEAPIIQLESNKEKVIIESQTGKENTVNFDNITSFCLILGFGNFSPFIYIKPSTKYLNKIRKEYSEIDLIKSITTNEDYSMFGPFNVLDLKSLYKKQLIDSTIMVKLVECLRFKSRKSQIFEFSEFNDLNKLILSIELDNSIVKIGEKLQFAQSNILIKEEESKKLEVLKIPESNKDLIKSEIKLNEKQFKSENTSEKLNENDLKDNAKEMKNTGPSQTIVVKKKKKARELDAQIGFYLMSKEESTYTQHYTAK